MRGYNSGYNVCLRDSSNEDRDGYRKGHEDGLDIQ